MTSGTLFETADRALYDAKEAGRNSVVLGTIEQWLSAIVPEATAAHREKRVDDHIFAKQSARATRATMLHK